MLGGIEIYDCSYDIYKETLLARNTNYTEDRIETNGINHKAQESQVELSVIDLDTHRPLTSAADAGLDEGEKWVYLCGIFNLLLNGLFHGNASMPTDIAPRMKRVQCISS